MAEKLYGDPKEGARQQAQQELAAEGKLETTPQEIAGETTLPTSPSRVGRRAMQGEVRKAEQEWDSSSELVKDEYEILNKNKGSFSPKTVKAYLGHKSETLEKELTASATILLEDERIKHPGKDAEFKALDQICKGRDYKKLQIIKAGENFPEAKTLGLNRTAYQWLREGQSSPWHTFDQYSSAEEAAAKLDLPLTPEFVKSIDLPAGTQILESRVKGGTFEDHPGGGNQFLIISGSRKKVAS